MNHNPHSYLAFTLSRFLVTFRTEILLCGTGTGSTVRPIPPGWWAGQVKELFAVLSSIKSLIALTRVAFGICQVQDARPIVPARLQLTNWQAIEPEIPRIALAFVPTGLFNAGWPRRTRCSNTSIRKAATLTDTLLRWRFAQIWFCTPHAYILMMNQKLINFS